MEIGPIVRDGPPPPRNMRKTVFGTMEVGDKREFRGDARELRNVRSGAHYIGSEFGWVFATRTKGDTITVWRVE